MKGCQSWGTPLRLGDQATGVTPPFSQVLLPGVLVCHGLGAHWAALFSVSWDYTQSRLILPSCLPEVAGALWVPLQPPRAGLGASEGAPGSPRTLCQWLGFPRLSAQPRGADLGGRVIKNAQNFIINQNIGFS